MTRWCISVEVWPHSTGKGADEDQKAVGARKRFFYVTAGTTDFATVVKRANDFCEGLQSHPMVWMTPIVGIVQVDRP